MTFKEYKYFLLSDLYRVAGNTRLATLLRHVLFGESYKYNFWMRTCRYSSNGTVLKLLLYPLLRLILRHYVYKLGISIPYRTEIDSGFFIGHFGGIVVSGNSKIGKNCNISHGVTLGKSNRGKHPGFPSLGNYVYIGPGAKIVGGIKIGNNVAIGANCVVTKDIPDNAVVVGVPGKVISFNGSKDYINRTDYEDKI
ncbi:MAG TPA: serine acetyltransferase [Lentisphaeria bacterium]|nr:MAG: serine acetyltransferase [Lentisphaerae bacterium GWF2_50_93]HCE42079.1 serine acetyltransferase [Lentisphaeria bacterium]